MSKDLLLDRYGRFYQIPKFMAQEGHEVVLLTLHYQGARGLRESLCQQTAGGNLAVKDYGYLSVFTLHYLFSSVRLAQRFKPDVVIGASDIPHLIMGFLLTRSCGAKFIADLYDQFSAYPSGKFPGVGAAYHWVLSKADAVTCVSNTLANWVKTKTGTNDKRVTHIGNAVDASFLVPCQDRLAARASLGILPDAIVIGTTGALTNNRDITTLYKALDILKEKSHSLFLVVAGPRDIQLPVPKRSDILDLGIVQHSRIPEILSTLNLGIIVNKDSLFSRNCFPQKYFEMRSMGLPVVAADIGDISDYGPEDNTWHYTPGSPESLANSIIEALSKCNHEHKTEIPSWHDQANAMLKVAHELE